MCIECTAASDSYSEVELLFESESFGLVNVCCASTGNRSFIHNFHKVHHEKLMFLFWSILRLIRFRQELKIGIIESMQCASVMDAFAPGQRREFRFVVFLFKSDD